VSDLPALLRELAPNVTGLEEHKFDQSYLQFLDTQIRLSPRGLKWTERLKLRRDAFAPFCDVTLLRGRVPFPGGDFTVEIELRTGAIVHWEEYKYGELY
jgi:hypothetical protein